jgi:3,4-dihydroxy 2-butanone 4-phosphate synthase / GTP cyclohydrolase II
MPGSSPTSAAPSAPFSPISEALDDLRRGKMIILTDDEDRENEGDLIIPAQFVTPAVITFMLSVARGYMCLALTEADCDRLDLHPQSAVNTTVRATAFTVSIDLHPKFGGTTGVSAKERAACIQMAIDPSTKPDDFVRPGHINPLRSRNGGVLVRTGQTEGSVDLCRLAGLTPAAVIIEIMRDDGEMARLPDLITLAKQHDLKICSVAQIIQHRLQRESLIKRLEPISGTPIKTRFGDFNLIAFESLVDPMPHVALCHGGVGELDLQGSVKQQTEPTLVRMHRRNLLGDVFQVLSSGGAGSSSTTSSDALHASMRAIQQAGRGAIVYLRPESASDPLEQRLQSIRRDALQSGSDTPDLIRPDGLSQGLPKHMRTFGIGGQILRQLGVQDLRLLSNHAAELPNLEAFGLRIVERVGL